MGEDVDGDPSDGMERREKEHGLLGREAKNRSALRDDDECLLVVEIRIDVADGGRGELQGELPVTAREVIAY